MSNEYLSLVGVAFIQLTLWLATTLLVTKLLSRQPAAIRHAALLVALITAPVLFAAAASRVKPDWTIEIPTAGVDSAVVSARPAHVSETTPVAGFACTVMSTDWPTGTSTGAPGNWGELSTSSQSSDAFGQASMASFGCSATANETKPNASPMTGTLPETNVAETATFTAARRASGWLSPLAATLLWCLPAAMLITATVWRVALLGRRVGGYDLIEPATLGDRVQRMLSRLKRLRVRRADQSLMPFAAGVVRPIIVLPDNYEDWTSSRLPVVMAHEAAHVSRRDPAMHLLARLACCVLWFHPLMWILLSRLQRESELAADEQALGQGLSRAEYAEQLLSVFREYRTASASLLGVTAMASTGSVSRRIEAVLNYESQSSHSRKSRRGMLAIAVLVPLLAASVRVQTVQASAANRPPAADATSDAARSEVVGNEAAESIVARKAREADIVERTHALREDIAREMADRWVDDVGDDHHVTVRVLMDAYRQLGLEREASDLTRLVQSSARKEIAYTIRDSTHTVFHRCMAVGDFAAAWTTIGDLQKSAHAWNAADWISAAIRSGRVELALETIDILRQASAEHPKGSRLQTILQVSTGELAIAAALLDRPDISTQALQRFRSLLDKSGELSDRGWAEDTTWFVLAHARAWAFLHALALSGHGDDAVEIWERHRPAIEGEENPAGLGDWPRWRSFRLEGFCRALARGGYRSHADAIARNQFGNDVSPELWMSLSLIALDRGEIERAEADRLIFIRAAERAESMHAAWRKKVPDISAASLQLAEYSRAASLIQNFMTELKKRDQHRFAEPLAVRLGRLIDLFRRHFEDECTVADLKNYRRIVQHPYPFRIDSFVGVVSPERLDTLVDKQHGFLRSSFGILNSNGRFTDTDRLTEFEFERDEVFAELGRPPQSRKTRRVRDAGKIIDLLVSTGQMEPARKMFDRLVKRVFDFDHASYVSSSLGGRVVNGATADCYVVMRLAPYFDDLSIATRLIESLGYRGEQIDGYRVVAKAYAKSSDLETARAWALSLADDDYRTAALVGLLEATIADIDEPSRRQTSLDETLGDFRNAGFPFLMLARGC